MTEVEYIYEERAAIMQFDARMTKEQSESAARVDTARTTNKRSSNDSSAIGGVS